MRTELKTVVRFYLKDLHLIKLGQKKTTLHITGASCIGNLLVATGKIVIAIISMSFFTCASALYSYAIVIAKGYVLYGLSQTQENIPKQYDYYKRSGKLLVIAGTAYIVYSIKLCFIATTTQFDMNMALSIACFTFVELGLNIRGIIVERKNQMPLFHALKIINLASSCICLVLTQVAILSFTSLESGIAHNPVSNGFMGIAMGGVSTLLGVYLLLRADHIMDNTPSKHLCKQVQRVMKQETVWFTFTPLTITMRNDGKRILEISCEHPIENEVMQQLNIALAKKMNLEMMDKHGTIELREVTT